MTNRRQTKQIRIGNVTIGGNNPIALQSMTNAATLEGILAQMEQLQSIGCDIVRMAVPDMNTVAMIHQLKNSGITMPIVADIHFDYRLAVESVAAGADKIRINPGNIGAPENTRAVVKACGDNIPIRIGVNGGSLEADILRKHGSVTPQALVDSAVSNIQLLEKYDFSNIVVSVKSSKVTHMIEANRMLSELYHYPLHLGVTEAGTVKTGTIKGAVGIGGLLATGIGDTVRVSLTGPLTEEIVTGREILKAADRWHGGGINVISCPTCARAKVDIATIASSLEDATTKLQYNMSKMLTVAVMGCAVNGPGEAKDAHLGIACGDGEGLLFKHGKPLRKVAEKDILSALIEEIQAEIGEN